MLGPLVCFYDIMGFTAHLRNVPGHLVWFCDILGFIAHLTTAEFIIATPFPSFTKAIASRLSR